MEQETQKFLDAEQIATQLVQTLERLQSEATSYKSGTESLTVVRQKLAGLIESTERVAKGSYEIIKVLKEIGTPEIMGHLSTIVDLQNKAKAELNAQTTGLKNVTTLVSDDSSRILKIIDLQNKTKEELSALATGLKNVSTLLSDTSSRTSKLIELQKNANAEISELNKVITNVRALVSDGFSRTEKDFRKLTGGVIIAISCSAVGIVLGVVALLK